ncbi:hypothetical protein PHET_05407 [Paragonimus heterotremus]|uniref:Uncharacterized protein n=1 Tax=Paragonimus heterotremus TaxID=100268 RepID=A0A8J4WGW4_9TREM|nr:hypothetical protein PHET_05407 [Paragonimus heterotremus]
MLLFQISTGARMFLSVLLMLVSSELVIDASLDYGMGDDTKDQMKRDLNILDDGTGRLNFMELRQQPQF